MKHVRRFDLLLHVLITHWWLPGRNVAYVSKVRSKVSKFTSNIMLDVIGADLFRDESLHDVHDEAYELRVHGETL